MNRYVFTFSYVLLASLLSAQVPDFESIRAEFDTKLEELNTGRRGKLLEQRHEAASRAEAVEEVKTERAYWLIVWKVMRRGSGRNGARAWRSISADCALPVQPRQAGPPAKRPLPR